MENKVKQAGPINLLHVMPYLSFLDVCFFYQETRINLSLFFGLIHFNGTVFVNFWVMRFSQVRSLKKQTLGIEHESNHDVSNFLASSLFDM